MKLIAHPLKKAVKAFLKQKPLRREIDRLVYQLYELTEEEIKIIEK